MIDVPVEVKDALRDGRLKKNYRIIVMEQYTDIYEIYSNHETYTAPITAMYLLYNDTTPNTFGYVEITPASGAPQYAIQCPDDPEKTWLEFSLNEGDEIYVSHTSSSTIVMLAVNNKSSTTEDFVIDNNNLVAESVNIDERMCSSNNIKFGLCEGTSLEFQYFGLPSIFDRRLQVFIDVDYEIKRLVYETQQEVPRDDRMTITEDGNYRIYSHTPEAFLIITLIRDGEWQFITATSSEDGTEAILDNLLVGDLVSVGWIGSSYPSTYLQKQVLKKQIESYTIPMGYFDVQKCSRQASTGIIKVTAYNKLMSEYLDSKANKKLLASFGGDGSKNLYLYDIQRTLLKDYAITDRSVIPIPIPSEQEPASLSRVELDLFFSEGADVDTPLSGYLFNQSLRDYTPYTPQNIIGKETLLVFFTNNVDVITTTSQYWLLYSLKKHLNVFVNNLVEYITDLVYGARFKKNASNIAHLYNRAEIASKLRNATNMIYIGISKNGEWHTYSLLNDAERQIDNISKLVHNEDAIITFTFPVGIGFRAMGNEHGEGTTCYDVMGASFLDSYEYKYYVNNSWTEETKTAPDPEIRFWDGSIYNGIINEILCIGDLDLSDTEKIPFTIGDMPEFTLRDIVSANYETACQFGQLSRETDLFSGIELNHSRLYPQETLYPDNALYPDGAQASATKSMYSQLWADEGNVHKWRNLIITYKGLDENQQEKDFTAQYIINSDGTDDYNCSDNWLFRNLVWTQAQITEYANAMKAKMKDMTWFPFEMWCPGLPYLETGDEIEIPLGQNSYTSYVLQRQLKGIQNLQDTYINGTLDIF